MTVVQIYPKDAFDLLKNDENSFLLDVRTTEEINLVGFVEPNSINNRLIFLPWQTFPNMSLNANFGAELQNSLINKEAKIIFICRSGARSNQAANYALSLGYQNCYNLVFGFEGEINSENQRGKINGWKASNLKWRQS